MSKPPQKHGQNAPVEQPYQQMGWLMVENYFFGQRARSLGMAERRAQTVRGQEKL